MLFVDYFKVSGQVVHTMQSQNGAVTGIAALNDRLYVSGTQQIAVYCPATFQYQQDLNFTCTDCGYQSNKFSCTNFRHRGGSFYSCADECKIFNMVGCDVNNCLYASDHGNSCIYKVSLDQNSMSLWSARNPHGLSVTNSHNLLVALNICIWPLSEYSTDGVYIRRIDFPLSIDNPVHALQLSDGRYGVIHFSPAHQFSILSSDGRLVGSYCGDAGDMNEPRGIAVDERGRVFVADHNKLQQQQNPDN